MQDRVVPLPSESAEKKHMVFVIFNKSEIDEISIIKILAGKKKWTQKAYQWPMHSSRQNF